MIRHQHNNLAYYTFPSLDRYGELIHAVSTRHGGISAGPYASLNLTKGSGDDPDAVEENLERICGALDIRRADLVSPNQKHTANVAHVGVADRGHICPNYDALVTNQPGVPLLLRFADCTPVLLYDPAHRALALVHSGWRGTVQGAPRAALQAMAERCATRPQDVVAVVGPSIGPCCYEVGPEVVDAAQSTFDNANDLLPPGRRERRHFDLWAANRRWLADAGVRQIEVAEYCTACHNDEFFSYRASGGRTGHFGAVMSLRE